MQPPNDARLPDDPIQWMSSLRDSLPESALHVRLFEEIINLVLGGSSRSEQVGLSPVAVVVIESDGAIEQVDSLRSTYEGATRTGYTVLADPLDAALSHPGIVARQIGVEALSATCRACTVHRVCGGGHYAHRYRPGSGFRSPSVYCRDLYRIIAHVRRRVTDDLARLASGSMA